MFAALGPMVTAAARSALPSIGKAIGSFAISTALPYLTRRISTFGRNKNIKPLANLQKYDNHIQNAGNKIVDMALNRWVPSQRQPSVMGGRSANGGSVYIDPRMSFQAPKPSMKDLDPQVADNWGQMARKQHPIIKKAYTHSKRPGRTIPLRRR